VRTVAENVLRTNDRTMPCDQHARIYSHDILISSDDDDDDDDDDDANT